MYNAPRFVQFPRQNPCAKKFPKNFYLRRASGREISQISLMRRIFCTFLENGRKKILSALGRNLGKYFYLRRGFCCLERLGKNSKISICTQKKNISICESATVGFRNLGFRKLGFSWTTRLAAVMDKKHNKKKDNINCRCLEV